MHCTMAIPTERDPIFQNQSQFWEQRKRLNMVRVQIASSMIPTTTTGKVISDVYIESPTPVFTTQSFSMPLDRFPISVARARRPFWCSKPGTSTDFCSLFTASRNAFFRARLAPFFLTHETTSFGRMNFPFEAGDTSSHRLLFFYSHTFEAASLFAIMAGVVHAKFGQCFPSFTSTASLLTRNDEREIFINRQAYRFSCDLPCSHLGLRHSFSLCNSTGGLL
jgi:hypothetical protein